MKNLLWIDSASSLSEDTTVVHTRNAGTLVKEIGGDLLFGSCEPIPKENKTYDVVIFIHTSAYTEVKKLTDFIKSHTHEDTKYYYISNEYNLGEAVALWALARDMGIRYKVIANHPREASKWIMSKKSIDEWIILNLNAIIYNRSIKQVVVDDFFGIKRNGCLYYGTYRKGREPYFKKYFDERLFVSSSNKNHEKFKALGLKAKYISTVKWHGKEGRIDNFRTCLYIEDTITHTHYNHLANRFYECLGFDVPLLFDKSCMGSLEKSGYKIDPYFIIDDKEELHTKTNDIDPNYKYPEEIHEMAKNERAKIIKTISNILFS